MGAKLAAATMFALVATTGTSLVRGALSTDRHPGARVLPGLYAAGRPFIGRSSARGASAAVTAT